MAALIVPNARTNDIIVVDDLTLIYLGEDSDVVFAVVNSTDYPPLALYRWQQSRGRVNYAVSSVRSPTGNIAYFMHRMILGLAPEDRRMADHIDGDGLNNRRSNLRVATRAQNMQNRRKKAPAASRYKGVSFAAPGPLTTNGAWRARVQVGGRSIHLGRFATEEEAALAYNAAARTHFGEFACLNDVSPTTNESRGG